MDNFNNIPERKYLALIEEKLTLENALTQEEEYEIFRQTAEGDANNPWLNPLNVASSPPQNDMNSGIDGEISAVKMALPMDEAAPDQSVVNTGVNEDIVQNVALTNQPTDGHNNVELLAAATAAHSYTIMEVDPVTAVAWVAHQDQIVNIEGARTQNERSQNWVIRALPRSYNKTVDKFFVHLPSDIQLRSKAEVEKFVRLGVRPKRPPSKRGNVENIMEERSSSNSSQKKRPGRRKYDWDFQLKGVLANGVTNVYNVKFHQSNVKDDHIISTISDERTTNDHENDNQLERTTNDLENDNQLEENRKTVEAYLEEAYQNLLNYFNKGNNDRKGKKRMFNDMGDGSRSKKPRKDDKEDGSSSNKIP